MIKALIFDLDNCLAPAIQVGEALYQPAFEAIRESNEGILSGTQLEESFEAIWNAPFDSVSARFNYSEAMCQAGQQVFASLEVSRSMDGYGDLAVLEEFSQVCFLVTSGYPRLQESKVDALGIRSLFESFYVDALDAPKRVGKRAYFERILNESKLSPHEVLVIGDNPQSEIAAGNEIGIQTIQTLRPGIERSTAATFHVQSLRELADLIERLDSGIH